ncbi:hypothetical protein ROHU_015349 [Labeo rohita]|uniref:Uncharacterized protein n=1 Tax=Labeo rohita TaxID=84645 RepID=A0A498NPP6_LABRO|nr:hypothetical protein ROHU_015349 [Labeo rohita]
MRSLMWRIHHRKILHTPSDIEKSGKQQTEQQETVTLHTFDTPSVHCYDEDPSEKAYSTVAYLLREADDGTKTTCLVTSKSRVAPLKKMSLRRLEFMGAVIGVKLGNNQPKPLNMELRQVGVFGQIQ